MDNYEIAFINTNFMMTKMCFKQVLYKYVSLLLIQLFIELCKYSNHVIQVGFYQCNDYEILNET